MNKNPTKFIIYILVTIILVTIIIGAISYYYIKIKPSNSNPSPTSIPSGPILGTPPPSSTSPTSTPRTTNVKIFLIAENDNGKSGKLVGCGDSAVAVNRQVTTTDAILKTTLEDLLSIKDQFYGQSGLYNVFYQTDLKIASVNINNEVATIKLTGNFTSSGTCDDPRFKAQIEETALQFPTVKEVKIYINNKTIEEVTSQK